MTYRYSQSEMQRQIIQACDAIEGASPQFRDAYRGLYTDLAGNLLDVIMFSSLGRYISELYQKSQAIVDPEIEAEMQHISAAVESIASMNSEELQGSRYQDRLNEEIVDELFRNVKVTPTDWAHITRTLLPRTRWLLKRSGLLAD